MRFGLALALLLASSAANAAGPQAQSVAQEAQIHLTSCSEYTGDDGDLCRLGQRNFVENYTDATAGRLDSWRNLSFFYTSDGKNPQVWGIKSDVNAACSWRLAVLLTGSDEIWSTDVANAHYSCRSLAPAAFSTALGHARDIVRRVKVVAEDNPKAPWYDR